MPVLPRRQRERRPELEVLTDEQRRNLVLGTPMMCFSKPFTREEFDIAWSMHGEQLTREWIEARPGSRPFGWWMVTHGQERPIINRFVEESVMRGNSEAKGGLVRSGHAPYGFLHTHAYIGRSLEKSFQQEEFDYLYERGLLDPDELRSYLLRTCEPAPGVEQCVSDYRERWGL